MLTQPLTLKSARSTLEFSSATRPLPKPILHLHALLSSFYGYSTQYFLVVRLFYYACRELIVFLGRATKRPTTSTPRWKSQTRPRFMPVQNQLAALQEVINGHHDVSMQRTFSMNLTMTLRPPGVFDPHTPTRCLNLQHGSVHYPDCAYLYH